MKYAFVDESERNEEFYFLGAVVVDEAEAHSLSMKLHRIMVEYSKGFPSLEPGEEFHASAMMRADREPWRSVPLRARLSMFTRVFGELADSKCRVYLDGINVAKQRARGYPELTPARELAFSHLFERINDCGSSEESVQIRDDQHHSAETSRSNFNRYRSFGTYGYRSRTLPRVSKDFLFIDSKTNRILQAADVATYIFNRVSTMRNVNPKTLKAQDGLWARLEVAASWPRGRARIWP